MVSEPGAPREEALTIEQLAAGADLDLMTAYTYCHDFASHLVPAGPGRWAPISVALLQIIHGLVQAGYSTEAIQHELDAATPSSEPATGGFVPSDVTERLTTLREEFKQRPLPAEDDTQRRPWWQRWMRRD